MVRHGVTGSTQPRVPEEARQGPAPGIAAYRPTRPPGRRPARGGTRARLHELADAARRARPATRSCCARPRHRALRRDPGRGAGHRGPRAHRVPGARQRARRGGQHPAERRGRCASRRAGHEGTVRELLAHGPDLSFQAFAGATVLHWAYFAGAPRVVALLLASGADATLRDPVLGCTPEAFGICTAASWAWPSKARQRLARNPRRVPAGTPPGGPPPGAARAGRLRACD